MAVWVRRIFCCSAKISEQGGEFVYHNVVVFLGFIFTDALYGRVCQKVKQHILESLFPPADSQENNLKNHSQQQICLRPGQAAGAVVLRVGISAPTAHPKGLEHNVLFKTSCAGSIEECWPSSR